MTESPFPLPARPPLSDADRRRRWKNGMLSQLEIARLALMDLPDDDGPEALDAGERRRDDLLADGVHDHTAEARRAIRRAMEMVYGDLR